MGYYNQFALEKERESFLGEKGYYEQLYANNMRTLDEMGKFSEIYKLPRLNHEQRQNLYKPIPNKNI